MNNDKLDYLLNNDLSQAERQALDEAVAALYFRDSSDYETALWKVVDAIVSLPEDHEEEAIRTLYRKLNPEV